MEGIQHPTNFGDSRQLSFCIHCGGGTDTRDHVPSRVFLDEPYPDNLPVVPACASCNNGFSQDEEYLACLVDCARLGTVDVAVGHRAKITRILSEKPALAARLKHACSDINGCTTFNVEAERVSNVVLKLARGHAAFEINEPQRDSPTRLTYSLLPFMLKDVRDNFETPRPPSISPEVGSRAMQRMFVADNNVMAEWIVIQPNLYRYLVTINNGVNVRMVIGEYLGCEVAWESD